MIPAPLAPGLAGASSHQAGCGRGRDACRHGLACSAIFIARALLLVAVLGGLPVSAPAQQGRPPAPAASTERPAQVPEWRRTDAYVFRSIGDVSRRMQFIPQAMQLRDFCADRSVPDDFVRERLQRFGRMTGREETCTTLLDY